MFAVSSGSAKASAAKNGRVVRILGLVDTTSERLPRVLGLGSAVALVIGITVGSGIFRSPAGVAQRVSDPPLLLALWIAGGLVSLCGALSFAELAAMFPHTGGYYVYLREAWGRPTAFLFGWTELVLIRASALGGIAIVCAEYTLRLFGLDAAAHVGWSRLLAAAMLALTALVNIVGIDVGAALVRMTTVAKVASLAVLVGAAFLLGADHGGSVAHLTEGSGAGPVSMGGLGLALVGVLWAYDGFADVSFSGGEVKNPQRVLPLAITAGTLAIIGLYATVNAAYLYVLPVDQLARSPLVAADMMVALVGRAGSALVSAFVALSTFGALNGSMLASPRVFFAMADDRLFFPAVARVHPRFRTPYVAIGLAALLGMALVMSRSFEALTETFVIAIWPFYALSVAGLFRLRVRRPDLPRPYRTFGYPIVPAIFVGAVVWFLGNALATAPMATGVTLALILAGIPVYAFSFGARTHPG